MIDFNIFKRFGKAKTKLKIAQIAPLWIPIPPITYGGIELMLSELTEKLVERGHKVTLFASGDSKTKAKLVPITEKALWLRKDTRNPHAAVMRMLKEIGNVVSDFDIIHNHFSFFAYPLTLNKNSPPQLSTEHRPVDTEHAKAIKAYPEAFLCAISEDNKLSIKEHDIPVSGMVYNGIDVNKYEFGRNGRNYLLYLGRLNKEKGVLTAIEAAKAAGEKLIVAGNAVGSDEVLYFMREVQPHIDGANINFVGHVNFETKIKLLKEARALLFPIDRREPFGLVMIEAMAAGVPVIAFKRGSVPEVIEHEKTGFIVENKKQMVDAIKQIGEIDRRACRKRVEENFTLNQMVLRYEELYKNILS